MPERVIPASPIRSAVAETVIVPIVTIIDGAENLRITAAASVACVLTIYARLRRPDGSVDPMQYSMALAADRVVVTADYAIGAGVLLNLLIAPTTGSPLVGECFVQAALIRGLTGGTIPQAILARDYTTAQQPVAWPGSPLRRSTEGQGAIRSVTQHAQTGAPNIVTVPAGCRWRINTLTCQVNTIPSASPDRRLIFLYVDGSTGVPRYERISHVAQPNGGIYNYFLVAGAPDLDDSVNGTVVLTGPPDILLRAGDQMVLTALNLDELDLIWIYAQAEEWLEFA